MNTAELMLTQSIPSTQMKYSDGSESVLERRRKDVARDFESILTYKILSEMESTIGDWGFEKDGAHKQIHGLFSFYLSDHIAKNGGLGLGNSIYESLVSSGP